jgi:hypothetical protein
LREAEEAFRAGRLDEAEGLLTQGDLRTYLPGRRLAAQVAAQLAQRGRTRVVGGESGAGWRDLEAAGRLGGELEQVASAREEAVRHVFQQTERDLIAGDTARAIERLEGLQKRQMNGESVRALTEVARRLESAHKLGRGGKFVDAEAQLASAAALRPDLLLIEQRRAACRENLRESRELSERLHKALAAQDWDETLALADRLLELAPESPLAKDARSRAWRQVGARTAGISQVRRVPAESPSTDGQTADMGPRFLLWVDGVGGYLVCLGDVVELGQSMPGNHVAVPILGNLSRKHARIRRDDGYVLEPLQRVCVDGKRVETATLLSDGDEIELGENVRLRFRQPHPLSATAKLEFVSRHRTQPSADAILLMAESCVLGPKWQNHVVCRDWQHDVVLYRRDGDLYCRAMEPLEIDGRYCEGQTRVDLNSQVVGSDFSFCLEEIALKRKLDKCCHEPLL